MKQNPANLPPATNLGGYVYAIAFSNGTVKVGKTSDPAFRFKSHAEAAAAFDLTVSGWWISIEHADYGKSEDRAIDAAKSLLQAGMRRSRREYFHGIDFGALVSLLQQFDSGYPDVSAAEIPPVATRATAAPVPVQASWCRTTDNVPLDQLVEHVRDALAAAVPWLPLPLDALVAAQDRGRAFGDLVAHGRRRMGMNQDEFGGLALISRATVSRLERGLETRLRLSVFRNVIKTADVHAGTAAVALGFSTINRILDEPLVPKAQAAA